MRNYVPAVAVALVAILPAITLGQDQSDVTGTWRGQCFGCAARAFTLKLAQSGGDLTGTIQTEGTPNFGDDEKPLLNGKVKARTVTFEIRGNPGDRFDVELTLGRDGKTLSGTGSYRGSFGLKFTRDAR